MPGTGQYARIHWAVSSISGCERHGVLLQPFKCVGSSLDATDFMFQLDRELTFGSEPETSCFATKFERFVRNRLSGHKVERHILDGLPLPACIDLCHAIGAAATDGKRFYYTSVDTEAMRAIAERGYEALCNEVAGVQRSVNGMGPTCGSTELCSILHATIEQHPTEYEEFRAILSKSTGDRTTDVAPSLSTLQPSRLTVRSISQAAGVQPDLAYGYLTQHGLLKGRQSLMYEAPVDLVTARVATAALKDAVDFETARAILDCSVREFRNLTTSGFVPALIGTPAETGKCLPTDRYSSSDLTALRRQLMAKALCDRMDLVPIREAILNTGCELAEALAAITAVRLQFVYYRAGYQLFDCLMVDCTEVMRILTPTAMEKEPAMGRLRLSESAFSGLVRAGVFTSVRSARPFRGRRQAYAVAVDSIRRFERDFVSVRKLGYEHGVSLSRVLQCVKTARLQRAFPSCVSDTPVYRRADVEGLDFQTSSDHSDEIDGIATRQLSSQLQFVCL
ncbi:hypothetical protein ASF70_01415 [Rhizobium sp. Leaf321]|nr:hypothetical protein ASF70_01415 [Rhizobium sp. Leaf321]